MSKRILVIDDEVAIRTVIKITLEVLGEWTVFTAASAQEGFAIAEEQQPDAILLDIYDARRGWTNLVSMVAEKSHRLRYSNFFNYS